MGEKSRGNWSFGFCMKFDCQNRDDELKCKKTCQRHMNYVPKDEKNEET